MVRLTAFILLTIPALAADLLPVPQFVDFRAGRLAIQGSVQVKVTAFSDARLQGAINRISRRIDGRTGLTGPSEATLAIEVQRAGDEDESYTLEITPQGAQMKAPTVVGALRGLETFYQLVSADKDGYYLPIVVIRDKPRFPWRGLLIDVCRHWEPVEVIKRNLDGMAVVKLNVLHWHLSEDQGFRVESLKYPKLHQMGSDGLYYTQDQIRDVVAYARERGIRVVPEFDLPGHATSWLVGYPEFASAPGPYQIERKFGVFDPTFDPTREEVYQFLDGFFGEMAALFPDAYMHIGGDENNGRQWNSNPKIQAFMKEQGLKDNHALQAYFNRRVLQILQKHGKKMIGWDEIFHPDLPSSIVVQSWRGQASLVEGAKKGYSGILSFGYYLDHILPAARHYGVDPLAPDSGLDEQQAARILGGEACMWAEHVGPETIDSRIWPRMAAIAERLWSPREVTDADDMYRRLAVVSVELEALGLTHAKNQDMLLRRMTGSANIEPLRELMKWIKPVDFGGRSRSKPTQQTPLTHLVDAARPESSDGRWLDLMVQGFLVAGAHREELTATFTKWRDLGPALEESMNRSATFAEARPLAADLAALGQAGLDAMSYVGKGAPAKWKEEKLALLGRATRPKALVEFVIILPMRNLLNAAADNSKLSRP